MALEEIVQEIKNDFDIKNDVREKSLALARKITQDSGKAIRLIHNRKFEEAEAKIASASGDNREARRILACHPDIYYSGPIRDSQKELVEATTFFAILSDLEIPGPESLEVEYSAYLNGLSDLIGELRRYMLDCMRVEDVDSAQRMFGLMDNIFSILAGITHHDSITGGLRHTVDRCRGVVEKSRENLTDLTLWISRERRIEAMIETGQEKAGEKRTGQ